MSSYMSVSQSASTTRRVLGWIIDYTIVMILSAALVALAMSVLLHGLPGYVVAAGVAAVELGWSQLTGLITHGSREGLTFSVPVVGAILAIPAIQFLYHVTMLAWRGRTLGKMCTGIRLGLALPGVPRLNGHRAFRRAFSTTTLETGLVSVALSLIIVGQVLIGMLIWAAAVVAFWANALAALGRRRRTVIDRIAGTIVIRRAVHAQVPVLKMSGTAQAAGEQGAEFAISIARSAPKATRQPARESAGAVIVSKPVQPAGARHARQAWKEPLEMLKPTGPE